jgi:hypothetical protein
VPDKLVHLINPNVGQRLEAITIVLANLLLSFTCAAQEGFDVSSKEFK